MLITTDKNYQRTTSVVIVAYGELYRGTGFTRGGDEIDAACEVESESTGASSRTMPSANAVVKTAHNNIKTEIFRVRMFLCS